MNHSKNVLKVALLQFASASLSLNLLVCVYVVLFQFQAHLLSKRFHNEVDFKVYMG